MISFSSDLITMAQQVKNLSAMQEMQGMEGGSLGREDPLE